MINVSQTIKNSCKADKNTHTEYIVINGQTIYIKGKLSATAYKDTTFIGTFNMKVLEFETENTTQFRNREFEYYKVIDGNSFKIGTFITTEIVDNDSKEMVKVTANDYALKFAIPYTSSLNYDSGEVKLLDVLKECCELANVELENTELTNGNFIVDSNQFVNGELVGDVVCAIAGMSCNFATITENDKLRLLFKNHTESLLNMTGTTSSIETSGLNNIELLGNTTQNGTPTPSSPQEVVNVTGRQEIKAVGKNLFDSSTFVAGSLSGGDLTTRVTSMQPLWLDAGTYTFSCNITSPFRYAIQGQIVGTLPLSSYPTLTLNSGWKTASNLTYTFTLTSGCWVDVCMSKENNATLTVDEIIGFEYQIEKGSTATEYEPYKEEINEINLGENLFDKDDNTMILNSVYVNTSTGKIQSASNSTCVYIKCKSNTTYTISKIAGTRFVVGSTNETPILNLILNTYTSNANASSITYKTGANDTYLVAWVWSGGTDTTITSSQMLASVQIEKGSQATPYSPYFEPIELCKIGNYEDKIFKTTGKNLSTLDHYTSNASGVYFVDKKLLNNFENNTKYTLSFDITSTVTPFRVSVGYGNDYFQADITDGTISNQYNGHITLTFTTNNTTYNNLWLRAPRYTSTTTYQTSVSNIMLVKGTQEAEYEPFGSNNEWYVKKAIGKVVLNGNSNIIDGNVGSAFGDTYRYYTNFDNIKISSTDSIDLYSNYFKGNIYVFGSANATEGMIGNYRNTTRVYFTINQNSVANCKTWLSTHNTIVYYVLGTPTYTKLNDTLQEQLNSIRLLEGTNNVMSSVPIDLDYYGTNSEIIEDYTDLDDKRDTQPITSVSIGSSVVKGVEATLKDDNLINEYGEHWLILNDNPLAYTYDKRKELVKAIFNKIKGFGYSSFKSKYTYKPYLTLGDTIKFKNKDGEYIDSMILRYNFNNDDCTFEAPSITSATIDYENNSGAEEMARRAEIIANQATATLTSVVSQVTTIEQEVNGETTFELTKDTQYESDKEYYTYDSEEDTYVLLQEGVDYQIGGTISGDVYEITITDNLSSQLADIKKVIETLDETLLKQTSDQFEMLFKKTGIANDYQTLKDLVDEDADYLSKVDQYIRFAGASIELGKRDNPVKLVITNDRISFMTGGTESAYISDNQLYITDSTILNKLRVGHWETKEDDLGNLNTRWVND